MIQVKKLVISGLVAFGLQDVAMAGFTARLGARVCQVWKAMTKTPARNVFGTSLALGTLYGAEPCGEERRVSWNGQWVGRGEITSSDCNNNRDRNVGSECNSSAGDNVAAPSQQPATTAEASKEDTLGGWSDKRLDPNESWVPVFFLSATWNRSEKYWEKWDAQYSSEENIRKALIKDTDTVFIGKVSHEGEYMRDYRQCRSACEDVGHESYGECLDQCNQQLYAHANMEKHPEVTPKMRKLFKRSFCDIVQKRTFGSLLSGIEKSDKVTEEDMCIVDREGRNGNGFNSTNTYVNRTAIAALEKQFAGKFQCTRRVNSKHDFCVVGHIPDPSMYWNRRDSNAAQN